MQPLKLANVSRLFLLAVLVCWFQACQKHRFGPSISWRPWIFMAARVTPRHGLSAGCPLPSGLGRRWGGHRGCGRPLPRAGVGEAKLNFKQWNRVENSTCRGWWGEDGLLPRLSSASPRWLCLIGFSFHRY